MRWLTIDNGRITGYADSGNATQPPPDSGTRIHVEINEQQFATYRAALDTLAQAGREELPTWDGSNAVVPPDTRPRINISINRALDAEAGAASRGVAQWVSSSRREVASGVGGLGTAAAADSTGGASGGASIDAFILDQAMLTAALELLPDKLANLGIIPLQLRLVHQIGQRSGNSGESFHVKELMATLGLSVVGQALETAVRKTFGGVAGGLLGRMLGGAGGVGAAEVWCRRHGSVQQIGAAGPDVWGDCAGGVSGDGEVVSCFQAA
jgi:hypothetical protein